MYGGGEFQKHVSEVVSFFFFFADNLVGENR
jgi:hypothetical protein